MNDDMHLLLDDKGWHSVDGTVFETLDEALDHDRNSLPWFERKMANLTRFYYRRLHWPVVSRYDAVRHAIQRALHGHDDMLFAAGNVVIAEQILKLIDACIESGHIPIAYGPNEHRNWTEDEEEMAGAMWLNDLKLAREVFAVYAQGDLLEDEIDEQDYKESMEAFALVFPYLWT